MKTLLAALAFLSFSGPPALHPPSPKGPSLLAHDPDGGDKKKKKKKDDEDGEEELCARLPGARAATS